MTLPKNFLIVLALAVLSTACGGTPFWLPKAHKIDIQQGNLISDEQIASLQKGMSREQVIRVIGEPVMESPFNQDRWDYSYTRGEAGEHVTASNLVIYFEKDQVSRIENNYHYDPGKDSS